MPSDASSPIVLLRWLPVRTCWLKFKWITRLSSVLVFVFFNAARITFFPFVADRQSKRGPARKECALHPFAVKMLSGSAWRHLYFVQYHACIRLPVFHDQRIPIPFFWRQNDRMLWFIDVCRNKTIYAATLRAGVHWPLWPYDSSDWHTIIVKIRASSAISINVIPLYSSAEIIQVGDQYTNGIACF